MNIQGTLTGLVPGLFLDEQQQPITGGGGGGGGLFVEHAGGQDYGIRCTSCAFQIGETAQIQSGGLLRATPHAVFPPTTQQTTRESFALFLEPNMNVPLELPSGRSEEEALQSSTASKLDLPPIRARWKAGRSFGDFHWNTINMFAVKEEGS